MMADTKRPAVQSFPSRGRSRHALARRDVLRLGGLAGLELGLHGLFGSRAAAEPATLNEEAAAGFGRAKRVIMLFLHGGHPQQETFDPKPEGPSAVRGEFGAIATSVPGVRFSEVLPRTAARMHKFAVVRSMSHTNPNHVQACLPAQTGHVHPSSVKSRGDFPPSETDFPPIGAVLDHVQATNSSLPTWTRVGPLMRRNNGTVLHGQTPGFLGRQHTSFAVDQPLLGPDVEIEAVQPTEDLSSMRLTARHDLLGQFDQQRQLLDQSRLARELDTFYQRAFSLLSSPSTRKAFDLQSEPDETRKRYGDTEFGQRCLLARRLAEAGVPMVNVSYCHTPKGSWDTHGNNFKMMRESLGPTFDVAFSALLDDLDERGMLEETLVIVNAEFGRTPAINRNAGRDHWPWVYSLAAAGAGIASGTVYGASDASAAYPASPAHDPRDFVATLYHLLGVPDDTVLYDALDRPHPLVIGRPIRGILA